MRSCMENVCDSEGQECYAVFGIQGTAKDFDVRKCYWYRIETDPEVACAHLYLKDDFDRLLLWGPRYQFWQERNSLALVPNDEDQCHTTSMSAYFLFWGPLWAREKWSYVSTEPRGCPVPQTSLFSGSRPLGSWSMLLTWFYLFI